MCKITNKLRLCTCSGKTEQFEHYWTLFRKVKGKYSSVIGEMMMPYGLNPVVDLQNRELLLQLLNEDEVFDEPVSPLSNDRLLLSIKVDDQYIHYGFEFQNMRWKELEYDAFAWEAEHDEIMKGRISMEKDQPE